MAPSALRTGLARSASVGPSETRATRSEQPPDVSLVLRVVATEPISAVLRVPDGAVIENGADDVTSPYESEPDVPRSGSEEREVPTPGNSAAERRAVQVALEQERLLRSHAALAAMRVRAERALAQARQDAAFSQDRDDSAAIEAALVARIDHLAETRAALCFGRIDEMPPPALPNGTPGGPGDQWYIGRRHVEDDHGDPLVLDWRVPVAVPFYRATWADDMGLRLRRRLAVDGKTVAGFFDEDFTDPDAAAESGGVPDPLLAELERTRSGEMRDIVATIQAEQDVIIRAGLEELVVVQGGPGTGKTAVGLHRAAFLLYEHRRDLERSGLLVVGPNELFLRYIAQVLPSLGERSVTQVSVERVHGLVIARTTEPERVAAIKGDARMAEVIRRATHGTLGGTQTGTEVPTGFALIQFPADVVNAMVKAAAARSLPLNDAREVVRTQMIEWAWRDYLTRPTASEGHHESFHRDLRARTEFKKLLDSIWPAFTAAGVVRSLLGSPVALKAASDGILSAEEQLLLRRKKAAKASDERWTRADLALLDEAHAVVAGVPKTYGHIVVDEAQDLSPMELRMVGRRSPRRSMTVLGDLAQATSAAGSSSWTTAIAHLSAGAQAASRVAELTLGYRVPAAILERANALLPVAAPHVTPSRSVRTGGRQPIEVPDAELDGEVERLLAAWPTVGVIVPDAEIESTLNQLAAHAPVDARRGTSADVGATVLGPVASKGLEFDAVVVVHPTAIRESFDDEARGARALYVTLTRAVQELVVVGT